MGEHLHDKRSDGTAVRLARSQALAHKRPGQLISLEFLHRVALVSRELLHTVPGKTDVLLQGTKRCASRNEDNKSWRATKPSSSRARETSKGWLRWWANPAKPVAGKSVSA